MSDAKNPLSKKERMAVPRQAMPLMKPLEPSTGSINSRTNWS